jgi:hypothetical protein
MTDQQEMQHTAFVHMFVVTTTDGTDHLCPDQTTYQMCRADEVDEVRAEYEELGREDVGEFLNNVLEERVISTLDGFVVTAHITAARCEVMVRKAEGDKERASCEHNAEVDELNAIGDKVLNETQEEA